MNSFGKFLLYGLYAGIIFGGIGIGWAVHPGWGMAVVGFGWSIVSFAVGYEPTPKVIERVR